MMNREQLVVTAGFIFAGVFTLALWTLAATLPQRKPYRSFEHPVGMVNHGDCNCTAVQTKEPPSLISEGIPSRPPGPTPDWLIGNARHLPKGRWYDVFTAWQKLYGDVFYMSAMGRGILVVSSLAIAEELTVKRSTIYSGRPHFTMIGDLMGWGWLLTGMNPSPKHTQSHELFRQALGSQALSRYDNVIESQTLELTDSLKGFSGHPLRAVNHAVASAIIRIAYGDGVYGDIGQGLIELNAVTIRHLNWVSGQFWLVEHMSLLQYMPAWMPGAEFKRVAKEGYALQRKLRRWPCKEALRQGVQGTLGTCLFKDYLNGTRDMEKYSLVRDLLAVMYFAGVDTTTYTILIFLSAVISHPHVQSKIHQELDEVLGATQPTPTDRIRLPYTEAAWKEAMRWMPTLPLCVPRATLREDVYNGWRIPQDTLIFINTGFMCRDPRLWDEPDAYKPERWLASHHLYANVIPNVYDILFGFGGRACPGIELANRIGFTTAAGLLSLYDVIPPDGKPAPTPDSFAYEDTFARYPSDLDCHFRRRCHAKSRNGPTPL